MGFFIRLLLLLFIPIGSGAQTSNERGIQFVHELSWPQILQKAKAENKLIFLDCYTTWCAPCKAMDKFIYPAEKVGSFFNEHFLSVKVQFDRTSKDDVYIKSWYQDAKKLEVEYSIDAYPTFIFLSPEGKPLHRSSGGLSEDKLIALAKDALNPEKQSYTLAAKYNISQMDTMELRQVSIKYRRINPEFAKGVAAVYFQRIGQENILKMLLSRDYDAMIQLFSTDSLLKRVANKHIEGLDEQQLFTKEYINMLLKYSMNSSKEKGFKMLYKYGDKIDSVELGSRDFKYDWSRRWVDDIIYKEEVEPFLNNRKTPDWAEISNVIRKKYNSGYAYRAVVTGKRNWATKNKNVKEASKFFIEYMEKYGKHHLDAFTLNNYAWNKFESSKDTSELTYALGWSKKAVEMEPSPNWIDTYANLLHKLGKTNTAIRWEHIAAKMEPENKEFLNNLEKMKKSLPTWLEK
jgi:thioredoxin-related protein